MPKPWRVRLGVIADDDLDAILAVSAARFGPAQAEAYSELIARALAALASGPNPFGYIRRDDIASGFRTYHVSRRGRRARHLLVYRVTGPNLIEVVRILHDRMDVGRHLPPGLG